MVRSRLPQAGGEPAGRCDAVAVLKTGARSGLAFLEKTIDPIGKTGARCGSHADHQASGKTGRHTPRGKFQNAHGGATRAPDTGPDSGDRGRFSLILDRKSTRLNSSHL